MKYIKGLDTLRAFAVFLVIIGHWGPHKFVSSPFLTFIFSKLIQAGTFGVDLFFVLSGYLITRILLGARENTVPGQRMKIVKSFYIRRALRIFPIYFLLLFFVILMGNDEYVNNHAAWYFTYTSNFLIFKSNLWAGLAHTWSLAVEEQFYLIWPWIIIFVPKKYLLHIISLSFLIGLVSTLILNYVYGQISAILLLPCITAFSIGALFAYVQFHERYQKTFITVCLALFPICIILLLVHQLGNELILIRFVNAVIAICAIIYVVQEKYNRITGFIFNNKLLVNMGKISYGIYLYHYRLPLYYYILLNYLQARFHLGTKLFNFLALPPSAWLIHLAILLLISVLSYRYIERAFLKLKKYFSYSRKQAVIYA